MTAIGRAALAAIFSVTLGACSGVATPATTPATATGNARPSAAQNTPIAAQPGGIAAQDPPTGSLSSTALIVGALEPKSFSGLAGSISAIRFSPDGKILAAGGQDPFIQVWDATTAQPLKTLRSADTTRDFNLHTIAFSPDGKRVAKDGPPLVVWDVGSGQPVFEKWVFNSTDAGGGAAAIAFSPDGKTLAAGDALSLQLLDASTGALLNMLVDTRSSTHKPETTATRSLAFSTDGTTLASAGPANAVTLWTISTGQKAATLTGDAKQINSVAFSPDGKYLAGGGANDITVWELADPSSPRTLVHHSTDHAQVTSVAFSADGKFLAGSSLLGLDLWDGGTWKAVPITTALNQGVLDAFAFSPDSHVLAGVATGQDHTVRGWPLTPAPATTAAMASAGTPPAPQAQIQPKPAAPTASSRPASSRPPGAGATAFDACTLVTTTEAEALLGAPVVQTDNRPTSCKYIAADGSSVVIDSAGGASAEYSTLMFNTSHSIGGTVKDIPGLGDKAFSSGEDPYCCALYVLKGSTLFEIVATPFDRSFANGAPTANLLTMARAAVSRL
jgi:WD40 repeat protein